MANAAVSTGDNGGVSRREFLYYVWGASIALFAAESAGLLVWFLIPKFREGEFGGTFTLSVNELPEVNGEPVNKPDGRFWLVNLDTTVSDGSERMYQAPYEPNAIQGVAAIYKVCTHLGCIYAWIPPNNRFECPCHGSKYRLDGRRIESPAPRTLDRFKVSALSEDQQTVLAESSLTSTPDDQEYYGALPLPSGTAFLRIDTGSKKKGPSQDLLCSFTGSCP
ncbi:MAG: Rieske 2Fe-2S domain-containing protein [Anaerolineae bacterium]